MIIDDNNSAKPFIGECAFCGQGMLRFWFVNGKLSVLCDECELRWDDIRAVAKEPKTPASGTFDEDHSGLTHRAATNEEIRDSEFAELIAGYSV